MYMFSPNSNLPILLPKESLILSPLFAFTVRLSNFENSSGLTHLYIES